MTTDTADLKQIQQHLIHTPWLVACLCAAWCDTCNAYRDSFDELALRHPDKCFAWLDVEDCAELVDALDIENFPTILIQHGEQVAFLGTMLPDISQLQRLLASLSAQEPGEFRRSTLNQDAPADWSLRRLLLN